jgi:hypothetical protein
LQACDVVAVGFQVDVGFLDYRLMLAWLGHETRRVDGADMQIDTEWRNWRVSGEVRVELHIGRGSS